MATEEAQQRLAVKRNPATEFLDAFDPDDRCGQLLEPLVLRVREAAPRILEDARLHLPLLVLATRTPQWQRRLSQWEPPGRSRHRQFRSLIDHLLVRYPVAEFLYGVFDTAPMQSQDIALFVHLAQGGSVRAAVEGGLLRAHMSRGMCHAFATTRGPATVIEAVRRAQVRAFGGAPWLADALSNSFLGRGLEDDAFWSRVIQCLCDDTPTNATEVAHVLDFMRHRRETDPGFAANAQAMRASLRHIELWQAALDVADVERAPYPPSGLAAKAWVLAPESETAEPEEWCMREILGPLELAAEGRRMRHCVLSYDSQVRRGRCSIWSLRRQGRRRVTVEVSSVTRAVVQVRGRRNRRPTDREASFVARWAAENNLSLGPRIW